ncbi:sensor histidine kinase [Pedobacter arcticus]|uniref:sensor histidine kinase n=1 Tax=Pedobacter arcticus TaxID=752140 RepID=UPI000361B2F7|nr:histidine kinase [Pedobacter arcticus]
MNIKKAFLFLSFYLSINYTVAANSIIDQLQANHIPFSKELEIAKVHLKNNMPDSAMVRLASAKRMLSSETVRTKKPEYRQYLKVYFDALIKQNKYKLALQVAQQILVLSNQFNDKQEIAESYYSVALAQSRLGQQKQATENVTTALKVSENLTNYSEQGKYYIFLSKIFFELRDGKKALYYSTKGYDLLRKSGNKNLVKSKITLPASEMLSGKDDLALKHLKQAELSIDKKKEPFQTAQIYLFLSHVYYKKKQFNNSLIELKKIPAYYPFTEKTYPDLRLHVEMAMAQTLCGLNNFESAAYYFERNIAKAFEKMDSSDIKECLQLGSKIQEGIGNNTKALFYLKKYTSYSDSLNNLSIEKAIHETDVKYQSSVKEKAISDQKLLLANKDNELYKKNRYILISFSAIILLVLITFIGFLVYRNRNQSIKLSLLKAQIHPHFLFNTLNNLYALSITKSNDAPAVVMGLANILRYVLYECNTATTNLKKEMDIISEYILLEKIRYGQRLEVNVHNQNDLNSYQIVPLLLLPLVENAYKHGASKLKQDSWINIETRIKEGHFIFKISNNKPTIQNESGTKPEHGNIGLKNIKTRLDILYPKKHRLKITDAEDIFIVLLEVPVSTSA